MSALALLVSFFALIPKASQFQQQVYGEQFSNRNKWFALIAGVFLFYLSLSFISALDFNPFIYFRF